MIPINIFARPTGKYRRALRSLFCFTLMLFVVMAFDFGAAAVAQTTTPAVTIVTPDDGAILSGIVQLQANVSDTTAASVEFFYRANEDAAPTSLGLATFDGGSGFWVLDWDTRTTPDTYNDIDTNGDGVEDTTVNLTKPPTNDELSVVATTTDGNLGDAIDVRIQNMLTARIFLPDNQEDLRGFKDLEVLVTGEYAVTSVRFDIYPTSAADPRIFIPFGEFESQGEPIENPHYGRPLGNPTYPTGSPSYPIGAATPEGSKRWVFRSWDTTMIPDGTYLLVATAEDESGRRATYMVETYIVNDLRVVITAPDDGATVSRFVALEARTSSLTGADNAAPGSLWPATSVVFEIGGMSIPATEIPSGSGRWRAVWDGDSFAPGPYTITATATNANPNGPEVAVDSINVTLAAPGTELEAHFPFDWSYCTLYVCSFLDGSSGGPTSWFWDFGDGNTSTDQLPTHTYATYGVYTVTLTVSDGTNFSSYSRVIPVGNTGVVGFNINPINDEVTEFINWTSAFKNFNYTVGDTLAIPVMWKSTTGATQFLSLPAAVCDADEATPNQECVIFTPEEADGTVPALVGAVEDGVLFTMEFTEVQYRGITDIFKGKVNLRIRVAVDSGDGNPDLDWEAQLGTNVDVTNSGAEGDENRLVTIISPFEGEFVGGIVGISAGIVSTMTPDQVEFFVNGNSIGVDTNDSNGWAASWNTTLFGDGPYQLTAVASFGGETTASDVRNVTVENTIPPEPEPPAGTFQIGRVNDTTDQYITFPFEIEEEGGGGPPGGNQPTLDTAMTAVITNIVVLPGDGAIGGDAIEFDIIITNTSSDPSAVLTAFVFQSKFSESPALASRIGDKAFYGILVGGGEDGKMASVKKNGTSNGLFSGKWKGICINSSVDFIPEFNSGLEEESLECGGNRADTNFDGEPELLTGADMLGLRPGESQTVRIRIEAGTTDGALHVVQPGTLTGTVRGVEKIGPNGVTYYDVEMDVPGTVLSVVEWGDNKVLRNADGTFNPTFAPQEGPDGIIGTADDYSFEGQQYLTLPRPNFAFTDILGRNHSCGTYGLHLLPGTPCSGDPGSQPFFNFLGVGDLVPGVQNFAAILQGFGEFYDPDNNFVPDVNPMGSGPADYRPNYPYGVLCESCGGTPFTPIAEFYRDNGDGTLTHQMVAGSYGALGSADQYTAFIATATAEEWKEEVIPEPDPGGPCDPIADPDSRKPSCAQLRTSATGHFYNLTVLPGVGINGGDVIEFTIDITNTSINPDAYLTAFNYQTKRRGLADIGILDGFTQDRRDVRRDTSRPLCATLNDGACYSPNLLIGHFPNVIGNGLLFGQMVWQTSNDAGREGPVIPDQVYVDPVNGFDPVPYWLESVKKNGPFSPILKGNTNFICVKSGLFDNDPDADAGCAGEPALLIDADGYPVPSNIDTSHPDNPSGRLGLPPGETQSVRIRMEFGDFRGALLEITDGLLTSANVHPDYAGTQGLARAFDCSDQRELEFCHPDLIGENIGYLPNTDATWLTPETLEDIKYVIINQPGDAPTVMNFQENFGYILAMAGFIPSAEFYAPDPNPDLVGTPYEGILIRQQVLGKYGMMELPPVPTLELALIGDQIVNEDDTLSIPLTATASNGGTLSFSVSGSPVPGFVAVVDNGDGTWTLEIAPVTGDAGEYTITITVTSGLLSDSETLTITVIQVGAPVVTLAAELLEVNEGEMATLPFTVASSNPVTITSDFGEIEDLGAGSYNWKLDTDDGPAQSQLVTITVSDGVTNPVNVSFTLTVINVPPTAAFTNLSGTINVNSVAELEFSSQFDPSPSDINAGFLYSYDCDAVDPFLITQSTSPIFNCPFDTAGTYTVRGKIEDKDGDFTIYETQVIVIEATNDGPVIATDGGVTSLTVNEGNLATLSGTFSDPNGDAVTLTRLDPGLGTLTQDDNAGTWAWSFQTTDNLPPAVITIQASDGLNESSVSFTFSVDNVAPTADFVNTTGDVLVDQPAMLAFSSQFDPSSDDTSAGFFYAYDCDGDGTFEAVDSMSPAYPCVYNQANTFTAIGRITDKDGGGNSYTATVVVTEPAGNQAPVAVDDEFTITQGTSLTLSAALLMGNDYDPDGDPISPVTGVVFNVGSTINNGNGTVTYTPPAGFVGTATASYTIRDSHNATATATIRIHVIADTPGNNPPVAGDDDFTMDQDTSLLISAAELLSNDSDADGDPLTISGDLVFNVGAAVNNGNGTWTYTPPAGFTGAASATYTVSDGQGGFDTAVVTVIVNAVAGNNPPVAVDDEFTITQGTSLILSAALLMSNDYDPDGDPISPTSGALFNVGITVNNGDGTATYTPPAGFVGTAVANYTISDGRGGTSTATITVNVTPAP